MSNEVLRQHVTSIGFSLTLSKSQIDTLVLMDHFGGYGKFFDKTNRVGVARNYVMSANALTRRGLFRKELYEGGVSTCELCTNKFCDHKLTKAGQLTAAILKEAGIYEDVLSHYGFDEKSDAA